jgi:hypothetical protein
MKEPYIGLFSMSRKILPRVEVLGVGIKVVGSQHFIGHGRVHRQAAPQLRVVGKLVEIGEPDTDPSTLVCSSFHMMFSLKQFDA